MCHHFCEKQICHILTRRKKPSLSVRQKIWFSIPNKYTVASIQICFQQTHNIFTQILSFYQQFENSTANCGPHIVGMNQTLVKLFTFGEQKYRGSQSTIRKLCLQKLLKYFKIKNYWGIYEMIGSQKLIL